MPNRARTRLRKTSASGAEGERFECWSVREAAALSARFDRLGAGFQAALAGAPCPGTAQDPSFRLGWEFGAVEAGRVPMPAWMTALRGQSGFGLAQGASGAGASRHPTSGTGATEHGTATAA